MTDRGVSWREFRERLREQEVKRQHAASQRDTNVRRRLRSVSGLGAAKKPKGILRWSNQSRSVPKELPKDTGQVDVNDPRYKINPKKKFYHEDEVLKLRAVLEQLPTV
jgi:hypothetical protein